jgi:hypothetical protein
MKLTLLEKTHHSKWYRTADGQYDVLGDDLNTNTAVGRAAGAGAVWSWRPAKATRFWTPDAHVFASKAACLADLHRQYAANATITTCPACGQQNRYPVVLPPFVARCGRCGAAL